MRFAPLLAALLAISACSRPPPSEPAAAYRLFLHHVAAARSDDSVHLLEDFDASTRDALTRQAAAAAQASGAQLPADPVIQLLQGLRPMAPADITVSEQTPDHATLDVVFDAGPGGRVTMVREGGRWRVHLDLPATAPSAASH